MQEAHRRLAELPDDAVLWIGEAADAGRFEVAHLDQMDAFVGGRGTSLAEMCRALDIPVKTSVSGADGGELAGRRRDR